VLDYSSPSFHDGAADSTNALESDAAVQTHCRCPLTRPWVPIDGRNARLCRRIGLSAAALAIVLGRSLPSAL